MKDWLYSINYNVPLASGVYVLINVETGWRYVGSTTDLTRRASQHFRALEDGTHHNRDLQYSFTNHGPGVFSFIVLEYCEPDWLLVREQRWLDRFKHRLFNKQLKVQRPEDLATLEEVSYVYTDPPVPEDAADLSFQPGSG